MMVQAVVTTVLIMGTPKADKPPVTLMSDERAWLRSHGLQKLISAPIFYENLHSKVKKHHTK